MPKFHAQHILSKPLEEREPPEGYDEMLPSVDYQLHPVKTLSSWTAASRPYRKKDRSYYTTVFILIALISLIAFFSGQKLLIGVLLSLGFLVYVLNHVPPEDIDYRISTQGITIGDHFYHWAELDSFWFSKKEGINILNVLTRFRFPGMLMLVLPDDYNDEELRNIIARFLPFHEIAPKSMMERWSESLQRNFPLENPHS